MRNLYPEIEPYATGHLDVGNGQLLYWETVGNPAGLPVVFIHGGPGGGTSPAQRRFFDPARYRIVLFDQRGCGRSEPHVASGADLSVNTTAHLIADLERLREHLAIDTWLLFGGSWGSTLALAYAQTHPGRVSGLILRGIFLVRRSELDWLYNPGGASEVFPDAWCDYLAPIPAADRGRDLIDAYRRLLTGADRAVAERAAAAWTRWEQTISHLLPTESGDADDPRFALAFATIENHYFSAGGFLAEGQLLGNIDRIAHLPAVIVQGRYDMVCPMRSAWDLHRAWPSAELQIVDDAGHSAFEPGIRSRLVEATDRFARLLQPW